MSGEEAGGGGGAADGNGGALMSDPVDVIIDKLLRYVVLSVLSVFSRERAS